APGRIAAVLVTAPKPVMTPHARSEAESSGRLVGMATAWEASTTTYSANAAVRRPCVSGSPPVRRSGLLLSSGKRVSHVTGVPWRQATQLPQDRIRVTTT